MKIAFVSQPIDSILPPIQTSVGACTYGVARSVARSHDVVVYGLSGRAAPKDIGSTLFDEGVQYRFLTASLSDLALNKAFWKYRHIAKLFNKGMLPPLSTSNWLYPAYGRRVAKDLREQQCDIIHVQHNCQYLAAIRALNPNAKIILHLHAEWFPQCDWKTIGKSLRHVDLVTTVSNYVTEKTRRAVPQIADRCQTVYNGIEIDDFSRTKDYDGANRRRIKRIMYAGAVSPHKGIHILLDALQSVVRRYPEVTLEVVGPPGAYSIDENFPMNDQALIAKMKPFYREDYMVYLKRKISTDMADKVAFLGAVPRSKLLDYFFNADIFVFPPIWDEGYGIPPVEAMAASTPVVATRSGAVVETVLDGKTGFVVDKNDASALADALLKLLEDDALRESMGRAGRQRVLDYFTWDRVAQAMIKRYEQLARDK